MTKDDTYTINTTLKVKGGDVVGLENYLNHTFDLIDFKIVPNTEELYKTDNQFKKIVKQIKELQKIKHDYIMKNG